MAKGIIGKKLGMTQFFTENGALVPVTVVEAGPCVVVQKKTTETDGYNAVQLGFGEKRERLFNKPLKGHFDKANVKPLRYLKEVRVEENDELGALNVGDEVKADIFADGEKVDVTGVSKGKGYQGPIKRWGFKRGPMSHGSHYHRGIGSLGSVDAARVFKGRKMHGRTGGDRRTVQNLEVIKVDLERNLLLIRGAIPGLKGSMVMVRTSVKQ